MDRINSQMPNFQMLGRKVLAWVTCARRQLTTSELQHALGVEVGSTELDPDNLPEIEDMVSACAGLVTFDKESNIIRFVHYTTQEYFERTKRDCFPDADANIAEICVTYLSFNSFESGCCLQHDEFKARLLSYQLYDYAARNWGYHARNILQQPLILDFLESEAKMSASCQVIMASKDYGAEIYSRAGGKMTSVHLAAYFGLPCITSLLKNGHNANDRDSKSRTPLWWAVTNEHEGIVRLLLENGADIEAKDNSGWSPLQVAMENGHKAIIKLLLEKSTDAEVGATRFNRTPLSRAIEKGDEAIVRLLLEEGASIEAKDEFGWTPLQLAAERGHEAIVRLLLEKGADVEANDDCGWTPLQLAAEKEYEPIVRMLLESSANIETKANRFGRTPLSWAAEDGHEAIARLLLEKGADTEAKDNFGWTPLLWAAENGHEAIVMLLLEKGANVGVKAIGSGRTPLWLAAAYGHEAIVRLLLEKGADVETMATGSGRTSLSWATENGHEAIVRLLQQRPR
jgi:ankyrin repeat protein